MNMHEGDRDPCEGPDSGFQRSCATALFELLAAAAGTWFIPTDLRGKPPGR
jgi:hypothetical protein